MLHLTVTKHVAAGADHPPDKEFKDSSKTAALHNTATRLLHHPVHTRTSLTTCEDTRVHTRTIRGHTSTHLTTCHLSLPCQNNAKPCRVHSPSPLTPTHTHTNACMRAHAQSHRKARQQQATLKNHSPLLLFLSTLTSADGEFIWKLHSKEHCTICRCGARTSDAIETHTLMLAVSSTSSHGGRKPGSAHVR